MRKELQQFEHKGIVFRVGMEIRRVGWNPLRFRDVLKLIITRMETQSVMGTDYICIYCNGHNRQGEGYSNSNDYWITVIKPIKTNKWIGGSKVKHFNI